MPISTPSSRENASHSNPIATHLGNEALQKESSAAHMETVPPERDALPVRVRLFVGGLPGNVSEDEVRGRFQPFGQVNEVNVILAKSHQLLPASFAAPTSQQTNPDRLFHETSADGADRQCSHVAVCRGFAYVDMVPKSAKALHQCLSLYNGCMWKGGRMRVEAARESFLEHNAKERTEREREEAEERAERLEKLEAERSGGGNRVMQTPASGCLSPEEVAALKARKLEPMNLAWRGGKKV
ncbi:unnamed protein product [Closterium sp. NIES-53]